MLCQWPVRFRPRPAGRALVILTLCFLAAGCAQPEIFVQEEVIAAKARIVAVAPLVNLTSHPKAGLIVAELAATQLMKTERFQVIEPMTVLTKLGLKEYDIDDGLGEIKPAELARRLRANTLLYGTVSEFRYRYGLEDRPAVGLSLRLLDLKTDRVIWAGSHSSGGRRFWPGETTLDQAASRVLAELIKTMVVE